MSQEGWPKYRNAQGASAGSEQSVLWSWTYCQGSFFTWTALVRSSNACEQDVGRRCGLAGGLVGIALTSVVRFVCREQGGGGATGGSRSHTLRGATELKPTSCYKNKTSYLPHMPRWRITHSKSTTLRRVCYLRDGLSTSRYRGEFSLKPELCSDLSPQSTVADELWCEKKNNNTICVIGSFFGPRSVTPPSAAGENDVPW